MNTSIKLIESAACSAWNQNRRTGGMLPIRVGVPESVYRDAGLDKADCAFVTLESGDRVPVYPSDKWGWTFATGGELTRYVSA